MERIGQPVLGSISGSAWGVCGRSQKRIKSDSFEAGHVEAMKQEYYSRRFVPY